MAIQSTRNAWLHNYKPGQQARLRLFCWPYAGGGASIFRLWPQRLSPLVEVIPIQLPGRESHLFQDPIPDLNILLDELTRVLVPYLDKPFAFFGHSMGALISFELARSLRARGLPEPHQLCVAAHRAPQLPNRFAPVHQLPRAAFLRTLHRLAGTPGELLENSEAMDIFLPVLRADFALCEQYAYAPQDPLRAPISVLGGLDDDRVLRSELEAWREQTQGSFSLQMFPGNHFFLQSSEAQVLSIVSQLLHGIMEQL